MKNKILKYGLVIMWFICTIPVLAGPVDPPGEDDPPYIDPTPVDSRAILLVLAGIILGVYFVRKHRIAAAKPQ